MNFGFNSNVRVGDVLYHVQTEDRGPAHPYVDTIVYEAGRVVYRRSTGYQDLLSGTMSSSALSDALSLRLTRQHQEIIAELEARTLNLSAAPPDTPSDTAVQAQPQLEVRLLNSDRWLASGQATLLLQVWRNDLQRPAPEATVEVQIEVGGQPSPAVRAVTDAEGRATVEFALPATARDGAGLVVHASDGPVSGELRFRLRARKDKIAPAAPPK